MSLVGKKEGLLRYGGMGAILLGLIISIIFDILLLTTVVLYALFIVLNAAWLVLIAFLKLETDFIVDNFLKLVIIFSIGSAVLLIIGALLVSGNSLLFIFISLSSISLIIAWNYSLSIYKKEKVIFLIGVVFYLIISFIFRFFILFTMFNLLFELLAIVLIILGVILIILAELSMKKKGLLNYI